MGTVCLAEQSEPVQRRVALKLVSSEIFDAKARRRFETERQALARLTHPSIAQLYDASSTEAGVPCFAMELVAGAAITTAHRGHSGGALSPSSGIPRATLLVLAECYGSLGVR